MPSLLAIETATDVCSVSVVEDDAVLVEYTLHRPRKHSEQLALMVREALRTGGFSLSQLDAIAVSKGPGSYTGLRIGVSTAKALVMAGDCDLIGVPTLEALAASTTPFAHSSDLICPLLDARRDEVYAGFYQKKENGALESVSDTRACDVAELPSIIDAAGADRCWLVGDGVVKSAEVVQQHASSRIFPLSSTHPAPSARWVGLLGMQQYQAGIREDLASFEPFYLKEFKTNRRKQSIFD